MNFLAMVQELAAEMDTAEPTDLESLTITAEVKRWKRWVNRAYNTVWNQLSSQNPSAETKTTLALVSGTESYNLPSGIRDVFMIRPVGDNNPVRLIPWPEYERLKADTLAIIQSGSPDVATIYQGKIWFYPTPDASGTVDVWGRQTFAEMTLNADEPDLPADFHRVVLEFALYYQWAYEDNPKSGQMVAQKNGTLAGQGGQAAVAIEALNIAKGTMRTDYLETPRMIGIEEAGYLESMRRISM